MIKPLTSLRFFFAFFVFLSHLGILGSYKLTSTLFKKVFFEGFLGVSFFFILSGFILSLTYQTKLLNKQISLKDFFVARFARIYPIHLITLIMAIPLSLSTLKEVLPYHLFLLQSFIPKQDIYFSLNSPSWSISDEMFFYALFPLLVILLFRIKVIFKILLLVLMISILFIMNRVLDNSFQHYWLYISPFTRIFDFILGILLFYFCDFLRKKYCEVKINFIFVEIFAVAIFLLLFLYHDHVPISYRYSIYYWFPMVLIVFCAAQQYISKDANGLFPKLFSNRVLIYLGEISFCFYMLHKLVIAYTRGFFKYLNLDLSPIFLAILFFVISVIASIIAFEKIEKPFNKKIKIYFS